MKTLKFISAVMVLLLLPLFLFSANKVIGVSGFENGENNCITKKWMEPLEQRGEFAKRGYKYVEPTPLRKTGRESLHGDIDCVCEKINNELKNPKYKDIESIDLIGHSKGGVAVENFSALIANQDTPEYRELSKKYPELFERWNSQPMFIENVVPVCAPMDGTFKSIQSFVKSDSVVAKIARSTAEKTETKYKLVNEGMLSLAKANDEMDYFASWKPGPARKDYLVAKYDYIVPAQSATKAEVGHSEFVKNSIGHGSPFDPNDPEKVNQLLGALGKDPYDRSDYNTLKVGMPTKLKDFAYETVIGGVTTPGKVTGKALTIAGKIVMAPVKLVGSIFKGIGGLFAKKSSADQKTASTEKGIQWTALDEVEQEVFGTKSE